MTAPSRTTDLRAPARPQLAARSNPEPAPKDRRRPLKLIVPMLERFIATDRSFAQASHPSRIAQLRSIPPATVKGRGP